MKHAVFNTVFTLIPGTWNNWNIKGLTLCDVWSEVLGIQAKVVQLMYGLWKHKNLDVSG